MRNGEWGMRNEEWAFSLLIPHPSFLKIMPIFAVTLRGANLLGVRNGK
jgi:hypothetical protein